MSLDNYFDITSLPAMGDLGDKTPMKPCELLDYLRENKSPREILEVLFLTDDLVQREALLTGELEEVSPTVLTISQMKNEEALPDYFISEDEASTKIEVDRLWDFFFRYAEGTASRLRSEFLHNWVKYEVGLRNALAEERANKLGLVPEDYFIATDLSDIGIDFLTVIGEWTSQETPLDGMKVLLRARWNRYTELDKWFTFGNDELAAYAAKLMLMVQWNRLTEPDERKI